MKSRERNGTCRFAFSHRRYARTEEETRSRTKSRRLSGDGSTTTARGAGSFDGVTLTLFRKTGGTKNVLYILE